MGYTKDFFIHEVSQSKLLFSQEKELNESKEIESIKDYINLNKLKEIKIKLYELNSDGEKSSRKDLVDTIFGKLP